MLSSRATNLVAIYQGSINFNMGQVCSITTLLIRCICTHLALLLTLYMYLYIIWQHHLWLWSCGLKKNFDWYSSITISWRMTSVVFQQVLTPNVPYGRFCPHEKSLEGWMGTTSIQSLRSLNPYQQCYFAKFWLPNFATFFL